MEIVGNPAGRPIKSDGPQRPADVSGWIVQILNPDRARRDPQISQSLGLTQRSFVMERPQLAKPLSNVDPNPECPWRRQRCSPCQAGIRFKNALRATID